MKQNQRAPGPTGRSGVVLLWVLVVATLLLALGFTGSLQLSSTRRTLERVYARELVDLAAFSAFEETAAVLERRTTIPVPAPDRLAELGQNVVLPPEVDPVEARASLEADQVDVSPVGLRASRWNLERRADGNDLVVRVLAVFELSLVVNAQVGSTSLRRRVTVRRYASIEPNPGLKHARLRVQATNLTEAVGEP